MAFTLTSPSFNDGAAIPVEHTCDGADTAPPLHAAGLPTGTRSLALIVDDPDAPNGTFPHWLAFNIPSGEGRVEVESGKTLTNGFGREGYGGPCPPRGDGPHRYVFRLYAVDVPSLGVMGRSRPGLESALTGHVLGETTLIGTYERR
jgi:Raf kinase inhibitor-like YbhB/YbcL family protein